MLKNECLILRFECLNSICPIKKQKCCTVTKAAINCECKRSKNNNQNFKTMKAKQKQNKRSEAGTLEALAVLGALYLLASFILR